MLIGNYIKYLVLAGMILYSVFIIWLQYCVFAEFCRLGSSERALFLSHISQTFCCLIRSTIALAFLNFIRNSRFFFCSFQCCQERCHHNLVVYFFWPFYILRTIKTYLLIFILYYLFILCIYNNIHCYLKQTIHYRLLICKSKEEIERE